MQDILMSSIRVVGHTSHCELVTVHCGHFSFLAALVHCPSSDSDGHVSCWC